jgi:hypothetical protein
MPSLPAVPLSYTPNTKPANMISLTSHPTLKLRGIAVNPTLPIRMNGKASVVSATTFGAAVCGPQVPGACQELAVSANRVLVTS